MQCDRAITRTVLAITGLLTFACASKAAMATADSGPPGAFFFESFGPGWTDRWHYSSVKKYKGRFKTVQPEGFQDTAIQMPEGNMHYGLTAMLPEPLLPSDGIVVQYEVKFAQGHTCGGAYLKLLSGGGADGKAITPKRLKSSSPFAIMFGPDRCGPDSRVHVILQALNPVTHEVSEHHLMSAPAPKGDKLSHVYTLVLHKNNRYKVLVDGVDEASGLLATANFSPPLQPPEMLPDPEHVKPEDWVEEEMMDDPSAVKPSNWDDKRLVPDVHATMPEGWLEDQQPRIPDPRSSKPDTWDESRDGQWVAPTIPNPACEVAPGCGAWKRPLVKNPRYKGPWIPPQVKNPKYQGPWQQRMIPNPSYFKAQSPLALLAPIGAVAFELWTTEAGYTFDSVLLGRGEEGLDAAAAYLRQVWRPRHTVEYAAAMAAAKESSHPPGWRHWAANTLQGILEAPALSSVEARLKPLLDMLAQNPELAWGVVSGPPLMLLVLLVARVLHASKAGSSDEPDTSQEDAQAEAEDEQWVEQLRQERQAAKLAAAAAAAANEGADPVAASTPAAAAIAHRRGQHKQQQQPAAAAAAGNDDGAKTPTGQQQQQQQRGSPDEASTGVLTRSTRRSSRKA